jgi:hypothetical protein
MNNFNIYLVRCVLINVSDNKSVHLKISVFLLQSTKKNSLLRNIAQLFKFVVRLKAAARLHLVFSCEASKLLKHFITTFLATTLNPISYETHHTCSKVTFKKECVIC